jgi:Flp pilus assembly protein TadG
VSRRVSYRHFSERGAAVVEFAIILPILLLCVLGLIEFARVIWTQTTLDYAVQAAARCAAIDSVTCGTDVAIQNYAASKAPGLSFSDPTSTFGVTRPLCGVQVTASLPFDFLLPGLLPYSQTLSARACYPA